MTHSGVSIGATAALAASLGLLGASAAHAADQNVHPALYYYLVNPETRPVSVPGLSYGAGVQHTLTLALDPGPLTSGTGTICDNGSGDETCGLHFEILATGDLSLTTSGFTLHPSITGTLSKHVADVAINGQTEKLLKVAIVTTPPNDLPAGPQALGTLVVTSGPNGGLVSVRKLDTVDANLGLVHGITGGIAYLPEPGALSQLGAGAAALTLLSRRRARRGVLR